MVWNEKFTLWGKKIGAPANFLKQNEWEPKNILAHLKEAIQSPYNEESRQNLKESISGDVKDIVRIMREMKG